jgi:hypothetical protein
MTHLCAHCRHECPPQGYITLAEDDWEDNYAEWWTFCGYNCLKEWLS